MTPVKYDVLRNDSLMTDVQGEGIAIGWMGKKLGVLNTNGRIVLEFEFDEIGEVTLRHGAPATRDGKRVQLNFSR